jgi:transcriptional regulator with XRE-family HTH domain
MVIASEIERVRQTPGYVAAGLALKIAERASEELEEQSLTQTRLAELMGVSRAHISSLLGAPTNMTLLTLAKLCLALGLIPDVEMYRIDEFQSPGPQPSRLEDEATPPITANDDIGMLYGGAAGAAAGIVIMGSRRFTDATT